MQENIHLLMSGYFSGNLTTSEQQELKNHLESNLSDKKIFEDYCLLWEESDQKIVTVPIDVESALMKTKLRISFRKPRLIQFFQSAAAVLIFAVLFSTAYIYYQNSTSRHNQSEGSGLVQEIATIPGSRSKFQLPDGTTVNLNSGSKLIFPTEFKGEYRKVELIGEAFFEVTPDTDHPFIVKTSGLNVKVLGTSFNLQAYPESNEIATTLVHGKVVLERELSGNSSQLAELMPSDRAVFNKDLKVMNISSEEDTDKFISWKDGKLVFYNDSIQEVAKKLENWYHVTVKIGNADLKNFRFTATFKDEPIEQVLDLMCKSSAISYQIKKATQLPDHTYSKRVIIFN